MAVPGLGFDCYNATKDVEFLNAVHDIWTEIKTGYNAPAMSWKKGCTSASPCNNSIANGPAIIIASKLYQLEGDATNLQNGKRYSCLDESQCPECKRWNLG